VGQIACGAGFGGLGFKRAHGTYVMGDQPVEWDYENVAGIDINPVRVAQFKRLTGAPGYVVDLFGRRDYIAFHSEFQDSDAELAPILDSLLKHSLTDGLVEHEGKRFWRFNGSWAEVTKWSAPPEDHPFATPELMRKIFGETPPDVFFHSLPCQGNSRLLPGASALLWKYVALNNLFPSSIYLCMLAWPNHPVPVMFGENVPGIKQRSAGLLLDMTKTAKGLGYATQSGDHDAGIVGGLAQSRPRFFWAQRHEATVPQFIYKPRKRRLRAIREVLDTLPMPGDPTCERTYLTANKKGKEVRVTVNLHDLPNLDFITDLRLALIRPSGDWKDIPGPGEWRLMTLDGREVPQTAFDKKRAPDPNIWGKIFVAELLPGAKHYDDVRLQHVPMGNGKGAYWVQDKRQSSGTITADPSHRKSGGASSISDDQLRFDDLRCPDKPDRHKSHYRLVAANEPGGAVTGADHLANGAPATQDLRVSLHGESFGHSYEVTSPDKTSGTVTTAWGPSNGRKVLADDRLELQLSGRENRHSTKYEVEDSTKVGDVVTTSDRLGSGAPSVTDLRLAYESRDNGMAVVDPGKPSPTIPGNTAVTSSNGPGAIADARICRNAKGGTMGVWSLDEPGKTVTTHTDQNGDAPGLSDARMECKPHNGILGVLAWNGPSSAIIASLDVYAGAGAVEDTRVNIHYWPEWFPDHLIISPWNAWHRPLTDLELAVLQGVEPFDEDGKAFYLEGSRKDRRQAIGNGVPPPAAEGIAEALAPTLIVARLAKDAFMLSPTGEGIWVQNPDEQPDVITPQ